MTNAAASLSAALLVLVVGVTGVRTDHGAQTMPAQTGRVILRTLPHLPASDKYRVRCMPLGTHAESFAFPAEGGDGRTPRVAIVGDHCRGTDSYESMLIALSPELFITYVSTLSGDGRDFLIQKNRRTA